MLRSQVFFWSKIRKNRAKYNSGRGFSEDGITKILFDEVVCNKDAAAAENKLLAVIGIKKFIDRLKTARERDDFQKHLRKYINIWLPDSPFEVATTNRYTITTQEAAVYARRSIRKGDTIKYLCGNLVAMTEEEEKDLDLTRRDFSIVMSSRKKTPSLFLGPARFANHDCNANARLTTTGTDGMQIVAVKDIHQDEEITVTYGEDYFGANNCECLCRTCELRGKGGWTVSPKTPEPTREESVEPYGFRRKRKYATSPTSTASTPDPETFQPAKRRRRSSTTDQSAPHSLSPRRKGRPPSKLKRRSALSRFSPELNDDDSAADTNLTASASASSPVPVVALPEAELKAGIQQPLEPSGKESFGDDTINIDQHLGRSQPQKVIEVLTDSKTPPDATSQYDEPKTPPAKDLRSSQTSTVSTDVDSVFENEDADLAPVDTPSSAHSERQLSDTVKIERAIVHDLEPKVLSVETTDVAIKEEPIEELQTTLNRSRNDEDNEDDEEASDSELSDLLSDEDFDDLRHCIIQRQKVRRSAKKRKLAPGKAVCVEPEVPQIRYPNDYVNTPMLLAEPESKWVQCKTCSKVWVQQNAYYTRRECPRCERHSKLYGYRWPKTEQLKGDRERIKDHREVHRFLDAEEEEDLKRKQRELTGDVGV